MEKKPILEVRNLNISFSQYTKGLIRKDLQVIKNLDLELYEGEILAVVGASGSGKSLLAHGILGILPDNAQMSGTMYYKGEELVQGEKERIRGREIVLVPQSVNYLDPLHTIGQQLKISLRTTAKKEKNPEVRKLLNKYGLADEVENYYPHQLSGGMARKVLMLMALAADAKVMIADEPTPGLDERALDEVLKDLKAVAESGKGVLMITHDINGALKIADKAAIFYGGSILEIADTTDFQGDGEKLRHPYTKELFRALPTREFHAIEGTQPYPGELENRCLFSDRCPFKTADCERKVPEFRELRGGKVRCIHAT